MGEPVLRVTGWIEGEVAFAHDATLDNAELLGRRDVEEVAEADRAGKKWLVEVSDPEGEIASLRIGNDPSDMVIPVDLSKVDLDTFLSRF